MYQLEMKGFNSIESSEPLELPFPLIDIMRMPMGNRVDADDLYKYGGEINRWLLDNTPLHNTRKRVVTYIGFYYLEGTYSHVPTSDWHCDGSGVPFLADDIFHTMVCHGDGLSGQLKTEFLKEDKTILIPDEVGIDKFDHVQFRQYMTDNESNFGLKSVEAESGRIHTWTSRHLHRVQFAKSPHFRLFWKVAESDLLHPVPRERAFYTIAKMKSGENLRLLENDGINLEQGPRGIILRGMKIKE